MHKDKPIIYVCSPYSGKEENYLKAKRYGAYVFAKGGIPVIPHAMYHGILDDKNPIDRVKGLEAAKELLKRCDRVWVFGKQGSESPGMKGEIIEANAIGIQVESKELPMEPNERGLMIANCARPYQEVFGGIGSNVMYAIPAYIDEGLSDKLICYAIDEAANRGAPWKYAAAILERCKREGITTVEQARSRSAQAKANESFSAYDLDAFERMLAEQD